MVGVEVRDEDLLQVREADGRAEQLPLRSLRAVEQQPIAAAADEQGRRGALGGGHRARRAEEDEIELHGSILGSGSQGIGFAGR